ncbi:MAG TPA: LysM peptidoglycan-binding domain-containing protein [Ilumatobacter sp.]|nr:LysM peptidoglycan-binding domain-containing protein [Ilumatobacter sp.]
MTRRLAEFAAGLVSLAALATLTVLPPVLLARHVGWPLPTVIPSLAEMEQSVRTGIDPQVIIKALALVAWVAWAQIAGAVLVETVALLRRRSAPNLRFLPGLQPAVGRLVATAALAVIALLPTASAAVAATGAAPPVAALHAYRAPVTVTLPDTAAPANPPPVTTADPVATVEVRPRDSLWAIAERTFGDGTRWHEIRDANLGRVMPDGTTITADTETIHPGWQLSLPSTAATTTLPTYPAPPDPPTTAPVPAQPIDGEQVDGEPAPPLVPGTVVVARGDNLWRIAERHLAEALGHPPTEGETVVYWRELVTTNRPLLASGDPNLIYPGEAVTLPPLDGETPAANSPPVDLPPAAPAGDEALDAPSPTSTTPTAPAPPTTVDTPPAPVSTQPAAPATTPATTPPITNASPTNATAPQPSGPTVDHPPARPAAASAGEADTARDVLAAAAGVGLLGVAGTGLGVGITRTLRRRRRRAGHLDPGAIPTNPHPDLQRAALLIADTDRIDGLEATLEQLARALAAAGAATRPRIVQQGDDHLDVLLTTAVTPAAPGWTAEADGAIWTHDPPASPTAARFAVRPVAPLLVTLGRPDATGGQLHFDLEADTLVSLTGDPSTARSVARSIVTELAYSPLADTINLVLVGDLDAHAAAHLERVTVVPSWADVTADLTAWAEQSRNVHAEQGWANSFVARAVDDHDALTPLVVVGDHPPDEPATLERLAGLAPAAIAVVTVGAPLDAATVIDCQPDRLTVTDLGLTCEPQGLDADTVDRIADLLERAEITAPLPTTNGDHERPPATAPDLHDEPPGDAPNDQRDTDVTANSTAPAPYRDPPAEVVVRVLGDITVEGGARPLTTKQTAVFAYIALNSPVTSDRIEDAIWAAPTGGSRRKRLANILSECRGTLGARHLPAAVDGRYSVPATVVTDIDLFERRVAHAAGQPPVEAIATLRGALDLVRGPVFTYRATERWSYAWVDLENWGARWEPKIASVAQHLAELCLDRGDTTTAIETAERALSIVPAHSGLTEALMRAHQQAGDHTGVDAVYHAHVAALTQLDLDQPADTTVVLYQQLRRSARVSP